jgi:hypothetical protein
MKAITLLATSAFAGQTFFSTLEETINLVSDSLADVQDYIESDLQPKIADINDSLNNVDASLQKSAEYLINDFDVRTVDWNDLTSQFGEALDAATVKDWQSMEFSEGINTFGEIMDMVQPKT